jgi:hypothetical protein
MEEEIEASGIKSNKRDNTKIQTDNYKYDEDSYSYHNNEDYTEYYNNDKDNNNNNNNHYHVNIRNGKERAVYRLKNYYNNNKPEEEVPEISNSFSS